MKWKIELTRLSYRPTLSAECKLRYKVLPGSSIQKMNNEMKKKRKSLLLSIAGIVPLLDAHLLGNILITRFVYDH